MMRFILPLIAVVGFLFTGAGCSKQEPAAGKPGSAPASSSGSSGNPLTAPVDYLSTVARAQQNAAKTVTSVGLDQAIKMFYGQEGRYPKDLNELVPTYINTVPLPPRNMKYNYDPKTGELKILPQ